MKYASFTRDWLRHLHVLTARFIYEVFAICKRLYIFFFSSKRKVSSYFQRETDKIIHEEEEKTENEFTRRKMTLDFRVRNLAISIRNG